MTQIKKVKSHKRTILNCKGEPFYITIPNVSFYVDDNKDNFDLYFGIELFGYIFPTNLHHDTSVSCGSWRKNIDSNHIDKIISGFWQSRFYIDEIDNVKIDFSNQGHLYSIEEDKVVDLCSLDYDIIMNIIDYVDDKDILFKFGVLTGIENLIDFALEKGNPSEETFKFAVEKSLVHTNIFKYLDQKFDFNFNTHEFNRMLTTGIINYMYNDTFIETIRYIINKSKFNFDFDEKYCKDFCYTVTRYSNFDVFKLVFDKYLSTTKPNKVEIIPFIRRIACSDVIEKTEYLLQHNPDKYLPIKVILDSFIYKKEVFKYFFEKYYKDFDIKYLNNLALLAAKSEHFDIAIYLLENGATSISRVYAYTVIYKNIYDEIVFDYFKDKDIDYYEAMGEALLFLQTELPYYNRSEPDFFDIIKNAVNSVSHLARHVYNEDEIE